jgi:hypothetical protein
MEEQELTLEVAKEQLREWKEEYQAVYVTEVSEVFFVWRGLTRAEYRKAIDLYEDDYERAEYVCSVCVLDPTDVDYSNDIYAGIPETLAENILKESGFSTDDGKIKMLTREYDQEMERYDNQISCVIAEAFPYFRIDEIDNWSIEKTLWYFSRAKWILKTLRGIELTEDGPRADGLPADFPVAK